MTEGISTKASADVADRKTFSARWRAGETLVGAFAKIPSIHAIEALAGSGLDFIVIDQEHAPFDRHALDAALFAAKALGIAALVRVSSAVPHFVLAAMDGGAAGILVPHVHHADIARQVAESARYSGSRGYSGSVRSVTGRHGGLRDVLAACDQEVLVVAQIEDASALDHLDGIAEVEGIDALFIGRGDLAVSLRDEGSNGPDVRSACHRIAAAAAAHGKPIAVFVSNEEEAAWLAGIGASIFVFSSDQSFIRQGAARAAAALQGLAAARPDKMAL